LRCLLKVSGQKTSRAARLEQPQETVIHGEQRGDGDDEDNRFFHSGPPEKPAALSQ